MISFLLENGYLVAGQLGLLFGFVLFGMTLHKSLWREPELYSPQKFQEEQLKASPPGPDGIGPDLAWPLYTLRQADVDRTLVRKNLRGLYGRMWPWPADTFYKGRHGPRWAWWILLFPFTFAVNVFLLRGRAVRMVLLLGVLGRRGRRRNGPTGPCGGWSGSSAGRRGAAPHNALHAGRVHGVHARHAVARLPLPLTAASRTTT